MNTLLDAIGNTPLVKLELSENTPLFAKLEYLNPGGSVKDRLAKYLIEDAELRGELKTGGTIIEASTGNQGVALAMIGAIKGYRVIITISESISQEKRAALKAFGAEVITCHATSSLLDPLSYHSVAKKIHAKTPNSFMPNQYFNTTNIIAHCKVTGPEIWKQTANKITHFFAAAGTGGTISGIGKYLKEQNPNIKIIAADSNLSYRATNGNPKACEIEGMGINFDSPVPQYDIIDELIEITDSQAISILPHLAHNFGVLVGPSSGAVAYMTQQYAKKMKSTDVGIMLFADSGRSYLSKGFYEKKSINDTAHVEPKKFSKIAQAIV